VTKIFLGAANKRQLSAAEQENLRMRAICKTCREEFGFIALLPKSLYFFKKINFHLLLLI
jgi:hypothetical protein